MTVKCSSVFSFEISSEKTYRALVKFSGLIEMFVEIWSTFKHLSKRMTLLGAQCRALIRLGLGTKVDNASWVKLGKVRLG